MNISGAAMLLFIPLAFAISACRAEPASDTQKTPQLPPKLTGVGQKNLYRFDLTLTPDPPIVGEFFQVVTRIRDARTGMPISGAEFDLNAEMPEHGHGMTAIPRHYERNPGDYVSEGLKFHMSGAWTITARASSAHQDDRITLRFDQPPRYH